MSKRSLTVRPTDGPVAAGSRRPGRSSSSETTGRRLRRRISSSAAFVATRYTHVENEERPSKRGRPRTIEISASWVASSASASLPVRRRQTPWMRSWWWRRRSSRAARSPARALLTRWSSSGPATLSGAYRGPTTGGRLPRGLHLGDLHEAVVAGAGDPDQHRAGSGAAQRERRRRRSEAARLGDRVAPRGEVRARLTGGGVDRRRPVDAGRHHLEGADRHLVVEAHHEPHARLAELCGVPVDLGRPRRGAVAVDGQGRVRVVLLARRLAQRVERRRAGDRDRFVLAARAQADA